jgi:hypothetical protein
MWLELLVAFLLIVASVVIHGLGTFSLIRWILPLVQNIHSLAFAGALWRMLCFCLALVTLHFLECASLGGVLYFTQHCFQDRRSQPLTHSSASDSTALIGGLTFVDTVVCHDAFTDRLLLHELVHVVQYAKVGLQEQR